MNLDKMIKQETEAEEFARDKAQDTLNIKNLKNQATLEVYKNKVSAYLDDQLNYNQRIDFEEMLGKSREFFSYYNEKKAAYDQLVAMIPEAQPSQRAIEQIELELEEISVELFKNVKPKTLTEKIGQMLKLPLK